MIPPKITPGLFLNIVRRRWYALAAPLAAFLMLAGGLWAVLPRVYKSEATILVQPQEVPPSYVKPTVTYGIEDRLQALSQQIMSRTRLLEIAREFGLYPKMRSRPEADLAKRMSEDIELTALRDRIDLGDKEGRVSKNVIYFSLSFAYPNPETARRVTARLASLFIEENQKRRTEQARLTTQFLDRELAEVKARLGAQERTINIYKEAHLGELPEQLQANLNALMRLQTELQTNQAALSAAEGRVLVIQQAIADFSQAQMAKNPGSVMPPPTLFAGPPEARLAALKQSLPSLEARYTASHPNVVKTRNEIARLEAELAHAGGRAAAPAQLEAAAGYGQEPVTQLAAVRAELERLKGDQQAILARIAFYQERVEATPKREQELAALTRDYESLQANYESLLKKRAEAKMAENLKDKGEQFAIVDPPSLPERPFKPSGLKLFGLALFLGLGSGLGLVFGLEAADLTFKEVDDLEEYLRLNILAIIPLVKTERELARQRWRKRMLAAACTGAVLLYVGLIYYARTGA